MSVKSLLNQTCTIRLQTRTTIDSMGGIVNSPSTISSTVKCRVRPLSSAERIVAGREAKQSTHRIYILPNSYAFAEGNYYIVIGTVVYDVTDIRVVSKSSSHREVDCTLRGGA